MQSIHLASALSKSQPDSGACFFAANPDGAAFYSSQPMQWFAFAPDNAIHQVPGLQHQAFDGAARTFFIAGQGGAPDPLVHEMMLFCDVVLADVSPGMRR